MKEQSLRVSLEQPCTNDHATQTHAATISQPKAGQSGLVKSFCIEAVILLLSLVI
jgi:hypothetical protein